MEKTFFEILPLAVAAAFSPSGLLFVVLILSGKDNSLRHSLLFLLGSVIFLVVLGALIATAFRSALGATSHPDAASSAIDIFLGLLIIAVIGRSLLTKPKEKAKKQKTRKRPYILMGFLYMIINVSSLIPFIAAAKIIAGSGLTYPDALPLFLFLVVVTMLMISFPVMVTLFLPAKSEKVMVPVKAFMSKHGEKIAQVYFLLIGIYLIIHGAVRIW